MIITLWGGPMDGRDIATTDSVWRSRRIMVPISRGATWLTEWETALEVAVYECRRWMPAWAGPCAMPQYRWTYSHTY